MTRIARLLLRHFIRHAYRNAYHILKINGNVDLPAPIIALVGVIKQRARAADYTCAEPSPFAAMHMFSTMIPASI